MTNELLIKLSKKENPTDKEFEILNKKMKEISELVKSRTFKNSVDMDYMQKNVRDS